MRRHCSALALPVFIRLFFAGPFQCDGTILSALEFVVVFFKFVIRLLPPIECDVAIVRRRRQRPVSGCLVRALKFPHWSVIVL